MKKILLVITILMTITVLFGCDLFKKDSDLSEGLVMSAAAKTNLKNFNANDEEYQAFLDKLEISNNINRICVFASSSNSI